MTITVGPETYPHGDPGPTSKLTAPSHSTLHDQTNSAVDALAARTAALEELIGPTEANISQARLATDTWAVPGALSPSNNGKLLVPLIWNITGRPATFDGAVASVLTAPDTDPIEVDIVIGTTLASDVWDDAIHDSIFTAGKLVIPVGSHTSPTVTGTGFLSGGHQVNRYLAAVVKFVGGGVSGADLTIQLNRLL